MPKSSRAPSREPQANDVPHALLHRPDRPANPARRPHAKRTASDGDTTRSSLKHDARPLLIGAGVGAALAFSVVALRGRDRRPTLALFANANPDFLSAIIKAAVFAIGHSSARRTFAGVVARAVGQAVTSR